MTYLYTYVFKSKNEEFFQSGLCLKPYFMLVAYLYDFLKCLSIEQHS